MLEMLDDLHVVSMRSVLLGMTSKLVSGPDQRLAAFFRYHAMAHAQMWGRPRVVLDLEGRAAKAFSTLLVAQTPFQIKKFIFSTKSPRIKLGYPQNPKIYRLGVCSCDFCFTAINTETINCKSDGQEI